MAESKRGITLLYKVQPKKVRVRLFFVPMLNIKFHVPSSSGSLVLQPTKGITADWTDGRVQTNMTPQLLRSWEHKNVYFLNLKWIIEIINQSLTSMSFRLISAPFSIKSCIMYTWPHSAASISGVTQPYFL